MLRRRNRNGEISNYTIAIGFAGITIHAGRMIDRKNKCMRIAAQAIHLATSCAQWFAQRRFRAKTKQAIENNDIGGMCFRRSFSAWTRFLLQTAHFFAHQFSAILFWKRQPRFDLPTCTRELFRGNQRVAGVIALACENDASARHWKKSRHCACDASARLIHQFFRRDAAREGGIFRCAHLRDSQNG